MTSAIKRSATVRWASPATIFELRPANWHAYFDVYVRHDRESGQVLVSCAQLAGVHTYGANEDEALANAREAVSAVVHSYLADGSWFATGKRARRPAGAQVRRITVNV